MRLVAKIEVTALIVAAQMLPEEGNSRVLDFVLVARGRGEIGEEIAGLRIHAGAIVLIAIGEGEVAELRRGDSGRVCLRAADERIGGVKALHGIFDEFTVVGFRGGNLMMPVFFGGEVPARIGAEEMIVRVGMEARRSDEGLAGSTGVAGIVAERDAHALRIAEHVAEAPGKRAVDEAVVRTLAIGREIRSCSRIVEVP